MADYGAPKITRDPLEILGGSDKVETPVISKYYNVVVGTATGWVAVLCANWATRRPLLSGIQNQAIAAVVGGGLGKLWDDYRNAYYADRDAVFRHYIQLHPDDFPPLESKKIGDILEPWHPCR